MRRDSAFFLKDARVFARRNLGRMARCLAWNGAVLLALLILLHLVELELRDPSQTLLGAYQRLFILSGWNFTSLFFCGCVGAQLGDRVFKWEAEQGTLESLHLTALEPWRLVTQKLLFPTAGLFIAWVFLLPFYLALSLCGIALPNQALRGWLLAGIAGLAGLAASAMTRSDPLRNRRGLAAENGRRIGANFWRNVPVFIAALPALVAVLTASSDWIAALTGWRSSMARTPPFFTGYLRLNFYLALALSSLLGSSFLSLLAVASPAAPIAPRQELAGRRVGVAAAYGLALAYLWTALPLWLQLMGLVALPGWLLVVSWPVYPIRERLLAGRVDQQRLELNAEGRPTRWSNPMLLRDLRADSRGGLRFHSRLLGSLATTTAYALLLTGFSMLPSMIGTFAYVFGGSGPYWTQFFLRFAMICAFLAPTILFAGGGSLAGRAMFHWQREFRSGTLPQLLISPLPSDAIVGGRWAASAERAVPLLLVATLYTVVGVTVTAALHRENVGLYVALLFLLAGLGSHLGGMTGLVNRRGVPPFAPADLALLAVAGTLIFLLGKALMDFSGPPSYAPWLVASGLCCAAFHFTALYFAFHRSIAEVESLRLSDMPTG